MSTLVTTNIKNAGSATDNITLDAAGNVGVGTATPGAKLDVSGIIKGNAGLRSITPNGTQSDLLLQQTGVAAWTMYNPASSPDLRWFNGVDRLTLDSAGNLGLGVTPSAWNTGTKGFDLLNGAVQGTSNAINLWNNAFNSATGNVYKSSAAAATLQINGGAFQFFTAPSGTAGAPITFTQAMTLTQGGNLLVGTTSDSGAKVTASIATDGGDAIRADSNASNGLIILRPDGVGGNQIRFGGNGANANILRFVSGGDAERARITSAGQLLLGTPSVPAGAYNSPRFVSVSGDAAGLFYSPSGNGVLKVIGNGNTYGGGEILTVGVESTNPVNLVIFRVDTDSGNNTVGSITTNGTTTVTYNTTSDYRLKTLIAKVTDAGKRLDALNPVEYEWKSDGKRTRGFFAHEFQEVYAGSVTGTKDAVDEEGKPVYQSMQAGSSEVIADLVAELQSLRKRVAALESK